MRVLIIEDEPRLVENIARNQRESAGYAVDIANNGREGTHGHDIQRVVVHWE